MAILSYLSMNSINTLARRLALKYAQNISGDTMPSPTLPGSAVKIPKAPRVPIQLPSHNEIKDYPWMEDANETPRLQNQPLNDEALPTPRLEVPEWKRHLARTINALSSLNVFAPLYSEELRTRLLSIFNEDESIALKKELHMAAEKAEKDANNYALKIKKLKEGLI
jgi:hypothetical protein